MDGATNAQRSKTARYQIEGGTNAQRNKIAKCQIDRATDALADIFAGVVYVNPLVLWASNQTISRIVNEIGKIEDWLPIFLNNI